jgi:hypothetical protein
MALVLAAAPANAQRPVRRIVPGITPGYGRSIPGAGGTLRPGNYYDPYGYSRQAAFNIALYGRAISQVPPYALGYNPYAPAYGYGAYGPYYIPPYSPFLYPGPGYYGY